MENTFKCDMCGDDSTGEKHKVYNENFQIQKGLVQCTGCAFMSDQIEVDPEVTCECGKVHDREETYVTKDNKNLCPDCLNKLAININEQIKSINTNEKGNIKRTARVKTDSKNNPESKG